MRSTPSSEPFLDSNRWAEAAAASDGLQTLTRGLTRARGFALFFAVCNRPGERNQLIDMLKQAVPGTSLHRVELTAQTTDVLGELGRQLPKPLGPVLILNLEGAVPSDAADHEILKKLNLQRPQWPQQVQQPVVFWVPQYVLGFIEREAPDFFDWRSDTVTFPELEVEELDHWRLFAWTPAVDGSLTKEARLARTEELRARLEANPASEDPAAMRARAHWLGDLADQLAFIGEGSDEAMQLYQEALRLCEASGDKWSRAATLGRIARIRAAKGEVDAALQLHQEGLGIFDALGDKRSRAVTLGDIARIRAAKGEVDAALQLHQENLRLCRELGDKRGEAVTLGEIARIRADKGEVDAALQLHQEGLGIFDALGDKRSRAVTLGDIARIRADNGEVDAALQLHQERLGIFDALGDKRSRAVTLGDIAWIRVAKGEVDAALQLERERLTANRELGDMDGIAAASFDIAQIELQQRKWQEAIEHLSESYAIFQTIDRLDGICTVGKSLGQLLCTSGKRDEGLKTLTRSRDGFLKLGQIEMAHETQAIMDEISKSSS